MIFSQLPHMRTSKSPVPRLVYFVLNMSICKRTFMHACRSCESSIYKAECFTCVKKRLDLRLSSMIFSQLPHMRASISPVPRLVYIPLNMSICKRTFTHACRSYESSIYKTVFHLCEKAPRPALTYHDFLPTSTHAHKYITCS